MLMKILIAILIMSAIPVSLYLFAWLIAVVSAGYDKHKEEKDFDRMMYGR